MRNDLDKRLLAALLAVLPFAEAEHKHAEQFGGQDTSKSHSALSKAYAVLLETVSGGGYDSFDYVWKNAANHNDIEGAVRLCAETRELTQTEARTLVEWYVRTCIARKQLLDFAAPPHE